MRLSEVLPQMEVLGADGLHLGTVDQVERNRIKLRRNDAAAGGQHHWLPDSMVAAVEGGTVRLTVTAEEARQVWQGEAAVQSPLGAGTAGLGDAATGTGGQSMSHAAATLRTTAAGEPGPRPDKPLPDTPSRDKDRDMRR